MHKIKQIIDNQEKHKDEIMNYFKKDYSVAKSILSKIDTSDEFITGKKKELIEKFKKFKFTDGVKKLFFMHPKRSKEYYAWWDEENKEAIILNYEKK